MEIRITIAESVFYDAATIEQGNNRMRMTLEKLVANLAQRADLSLGQLSFISIPENYEEELCAYQEAVGQNAGRTNDDTGVGQAIVVANGTTMPKTYAIFVDKHIAAFILDDACFSLITGMMDKDKQHEFAAMRSKAIEILFHELCHVHEMTCTSQIGWFDDYNTPPKCVKDILRSSTTYLWREYYAHRCSCLMREEAAKEMGSLIADALGFEEMIVDLRYQYNTGVLELNDFLIGFFKYVNAALRNLVFCIGQISAYNPDQRKLICDPIIEMISNTNIGSLWMAFDCALEDAFARYPDGWKSHICIETMDNIVLDYIESFKIYMSDEKSGIFFSIPVVDESNSSGV